MVNRVVCALVLLWMPFSVGALGLQGIEVISALNQPLDAKIAVAADDQLNIADLRISLASLKAFQKLGIDRPYFLLKLQFKAERGVAGEPYIRVTTRESVREPYLNFIISVGLRNSEGMIQKEYTLLLDPPIYTPQGGSSTKKAPVAETVAEEEREQIYGLVKKGETLWVIARNTRPDTSVSIEQMMMALQLRNPDAFRNNNVNQLKRGAELVIPRPELVNRMTPREAKRAFLDQTREWRNERRSSTREVAQVKSTPKVAPAVVHEALAEVAATAAKAAEPVQEEGYLRVVDVDEERALSEGVKVKPADEPEKLQGMIEGSGRDLILARQINQDIEVLRVALEGEIALLRLSLEEKDRAIEQLRLRIERAQLQVADDAPPAPAPLSKPVAPASPVESSVSAAAAWTLVRSNSELLFVAAAVLLLLVIMVTLLFKRKRAEVLPVELMVMDGGESLGEMERAPEAEVKGVETDVVPSLMMTDVYLGYHQYAQAESMISRMIELHPDRLSLKVKLLEVYAVKKDRDMFARYLETVHEEIVLAAPGLWDKVVKMGSELVPNHPLFFDKEGSHAADGVAAGIERMVNFSDVVVDPELDVELNAANVPMDGDAYRSAEDASLEITLEGLDLSSLEVDEDFDEQALLLDDIEFPDLEGEAQYADDELESLDDLDFEGDIEAQPEKQRRG